MNDRELQVVNALRMECFPALMKGVRAQVGNEMIETGLSDWHCCIFASKVCIDLLKEHYIKARALKVQVLGWNRPAWDAFPEHGMNASDPTLVPGALVWGCGVRGDGSQDAVGEGSLNGHVVVIAGDNELLLDPSAVQFSQLRKGGIIVEPLAISLADEIGREFLKGWMSVPLEDGGALMYRRHPDTSGVFDSGDWLNKDIEYDLLIDAVRQAVKLRLA